MPNMSFTNNAATTLASGISAVATSLTVATGTGILFPTLAGSQYFYCTLENTAGTLREIVKVTARSTDTFTIVRAQDSTTAQSWSTGDKVELRIIAAELNNFPKLDEVNTYSAAQTFSVNPVMSGLTASVPVFTDGSKNLTSTGTVPTNQGGTGLTTFTAANNAIYSTSSSALTAGTLPIAAGGTNSTATPTAGGINYGTGTAHAYTTAGTSGQALISAGASAPSFGTLGVAGGGTGQTTYTNGQLLIGNTTGNTLTKSTLTAGSGITITNGTGSITIAASGGGGGGFSSWQVFTSSGTFTVPTGITKVKVTVVGGGGGGGALAAYDGNVGGGGGGGTAMEIISGLTPGGTVSVTVGAGGAGAAGGGGGSNGGSGGTSSFGAYCSATGGGGGIGSTVGNGFAAGGIGSGGDLNIRGGSGSFVNVGGGYGGASFFAGYTSPTVGTSTTGSPYGGGGGGAISQGCFAGGGAGTAGVVVVEY